MREGLTFEMGFTRMIQNLSLAILTQISLIAAFIRVIKLSLCLHIFQAFTTPS
jgi:hypothetical protein